MKKEIHLRAVWVSGNYLRNEVELIEVIGQVDQFKVYLEHGQSSLFGYTVRVLGLSESVALNLIHVSRKAREVPELKEALAAGELNLSNARKLAPLLNPENQAEWITKASSLSTRELEREIVKVRPEAFRPEKIKPSSAGRSRIECYFDDAEIEHLKRLKDLMKEESLEEVFKKTMHFYLNANDPLQKAKRAETRREQMRRAKNAAIRSSGENGFVMKDASSPPVRNPSVALQTTSENRTAPLKRNITPAAAIPAGPAKKTNAPRPTARVPIPRSLLHAVHLRDQCQCSVKNCPNARYLEIHHIKPVHQGGQNTLDNLQTLCSAHHRARHAENEARAERR